MNSTEHRGTDRFASFWLSSSSPNSPDDFEHVSRVNFRYKTKKGAQLLYGDIIALAGDFYRDFAVLDNSSADRMQAVLRSKIFKGEADTDMDLLSRAPERLLAYYILALQNAEHFRGPPSPNSWGIYTNSAVSNGLPDDSLETYLAGHNEANSLCIAGRQTSRFPEDWPRFRETQQRAYAINAFYDHFLTDMYSSGHIRVPRRCLHGIFPLVSYPYDLGVPVIGLPVVIDFFTSREMHDEDGGNGLFVINEDRIVNKNGPWQMFGDNKQFIIRIEDGVKEETENYEICQHTVLSSISEVSRAVLGPHSFSSVNIAPAWKMIPQVYPPGVEVWFDSTPADFKINMIKTNMPPEDVDCVMVRREPLPGIGADLGIELLVQTILHGLPSIPKETLSQLRDELHRLFRDALSFPTDEPFLIIPEYLIKRWYSKASGEKFLADHFKRNYRLYTLYDKPIWKFESQATKEFKRFDEEKPLGVQPYPLFAVANNRLYVRLTESATGGDSSNKYVTAEHLVNELHHPPYQFDDNNPPPLTIRMKGRKQGQRI